MPGNLETLRFVLFGDDRASSAFSRFARQVDDTTRAVDKNNLSLGDSKVKLDLISAKAEELGRLNPDVKVQIDDAAAKLKLAVLKHELRDIGSGPTVGGAGGLIGGVIGDAGAAGGAGAKGLLGIVSTGPLGIAVMAGLAAAAVEAAVAFAPIAASLIPITAGFATLGFTAGPEVTKIFGAITAKGKDLHKALKDLSPDERDLVMQGRGLKDQFDAIGKAVKPEILKAFGTGLKIIKDFLPALKPLAEAAGKALDKFLGNLSDWLKSPGGKSFINWLETRGPKDIQMFGRVMWDVAHGIGNALNQIYRTGRWIDMFLSHWGDDWQLVKLSAEKIWDSIVIGALKTVLDILKPFEKIPFIGDRFKAAAEAVHRQLAAMVLDSSQATRRIQGYLDDLHGEKVNIEFTSAFVAAHGVPVAPAGHAKGTPAAAPGWAWVGEQGAELVKFSGGETVLPHHVSRQVARGYAAGAGWDISDVFDPRVAVAIRRMNAGLNRFENAGAAYVQAHPFKYWKFGVVGGVPGSVASYAGDALAVLAMLGQPAVDLGVVLRQMQTESGGNPYAVNRWDSNWLAGHPSVGLMQVIAGTFAAYAGRYRNTGPFEYGVSVNPMANIFAGLNYAIHRYGAAWTRVLGQGHGYDQGGWLPPGLSLAYNGTGRPERVGGGDTYNIVVNMPPGSDGADVVRALQRYAQRNGPIKLKVRS